MKDLIFLRHAKSEGNITDSEKGIKFIGRKKDYNIIVPEQEKIDSLKNLVSGYSLVFSSPLKRCKQSLELITNASIKEDNNLLEIDYGDADGLHLKEIQDKYSYLFKGWRNGEDPRFPNGENSQGVLERYKSFMNDLKNYEQDKILICTHNVFLRVVLGDSLEIPVKDWFKISIPHFEALKFELQGEKLIYKGSKEQKKRIFIYL